MEHLMTECVNNDVSRAKLVSSYLSQSILFFQSSFVIAICIQNHLVAILIQQPSSCNHTLISLAILNNQQL
jgi:hypothetical protein